jgi:hypothetical protein
MFAKFKGNPSADTVTLEVIGVATGIFKFGGEEEISPETARNAGDLSSRVRGILRKPAGMDPEIRAFLTDAQEKLADLALTPSAHRLNIIDLKSRQARLQDSPKFHQKLGAMRDDFGAWATDIFDRHFLPETKQLTAVLPKDRDGLHHHGTAAVYSVAIAHTLKRI